MKNELKIGRINGHVVGRLLKEAVRRASVVIRNERAVFESTVKESYAGGMDDVFTSADTKAQEVYLRMFRECFPDCGVIGEEDSLALDPRNGCQAYFTVDPLDGTKAYIRRQSHGVATMVALVDGGEVISAYVGDINAEEVYGFRPGSDKVHRITRLDTFQEMDANPKSTGVLFGLLRDPLDTYSAHTQELVGHFKSYEVMGSSIGTWMARLWKREVSAAILSPGHETPWDSTPFIGISIKLGYVFFRPGSEPGAWEEFIPSLPREVTKRDYDVLVLHRNDARTFGLL